MNIVWNENPFKTTIEIDDRDKERILLYIQGEEYSDILCDVVLRIEGKIEKDEEVTLESIHKRLKKWREICNMTVESPEVQSYIDFLSFEHDGDCTCLPMSCARCQAEEALGIDSIKGLGKHSARKIQGTYGPNTTIIEALESLATRPEYKKPDTWSDSVGYDVHIPRWEQERIKAYEWLLDYKNKHGF